MKIFITANGDFQKINCRNLLLGRFLSDDSESYVHWRLRVFLYSEDVELKRRLKFWMRRIHFFESQRRGPNETFKLKNVFHSQTFPIHAFFGVFFGKEILSFAKSSLRTLPQSKR